jgi:hypothetical protein
MNKAFRHGDIALLKVISIPKEAKKSDSKVLMVGSHQNNHSFTNGKFYELKQGDYIIGYLEAKNTKLFHPEHSPNGVKIPNGVYEIRKQCEYTPSGLIPVVD